MNDMICYHLPIVFNGFGKHRYAQILVLFEFDPEDCMILKNVIHASKFFHLPGPDHFFNHFGGILIQLPLSAGFRYFSSTYAGSSWYAQSDCGSAA